MTLTVSLIVTHVADEAWMRVFSVSRGSVKNSAATDANNDTTIVPGYDSSGMFLVLFGNKNNKKKKDFFQSMLFLKYFFQKD